MAIFVESPWPILLMGVAVELVLAIMLLRTGRGRTLWMMLGVAAIVLLGLAVERLVLTHREAVEDTLERCLDAVKANDLPRLLDCISPKAQDIRTAAEMVLVRFECEKGAITDLEITIDRQANPPTAKAHFRAIGTARDRKGEFPYQGFSEKLTVELRREGGRWLVADCQSEIPELR